MVGDIDDNAVPLGFDPELIVLKVHLPRIELVPFGHVWRMEGVLGVSTCQRDRCDEMLRIEPFVGAERLVA